MSLVTAHINAANSITSHIEILLEDTVIRVREKLVSVVSSKDNYYSSIIMVDKLKMVSWNVRGMNNKFKRASVFQYLKQSKPHIILLQETHLDGNRVMSLRKPWIQRALHSTYSTFARDVSILISKSVPCTIHRVITDPGGRFVAVAINVYHYQILLVNVYVPPPFQGQLLFDMLNKLAQFLHLPVLFFGRFQRNSRCGLGLF